MLVGNDADVCETAEEHQRSKLIFLSRSGGRETGEQRAGAASLEGDAGRVEDTPHKPRTIESIWSFRAPAITRAEPLVYGRH